MFAINLILAIGVGILTATFIAAGVYYIVDQSTTHRFLEAKPKKVQMADIVRDWCASHANEKTAIEPPLDPIELAGLQTELERDASNVLKQSHPLIALRCVIMDGIDRRIWQQETLCVPDARQPPLGSMRRVLAVDALRLELLRDYGARKFGDYADNDWYDVYLQVATMKRRSLHQFLDRQEQRAGNSHYRSVMAIGQRIRQHLLATPPGTRFPTNEVAPGDSGHGRI